MKTVILVVTGFCLVAAAGYLIGRHPKQIPNSTSVITDPVQAVVEPEQQSFLPSTASKPQPAPVVTENVPPSSSAPAPVATPKAPVSLPFQQALEVLVAPQAGFGQKQAAWEQLKNSGKLDQAIAELEQRATANPTVAGYPAALGQACLQKAGTLKDVREQGVLGLKADASFEAALNIDPNNWDARFWKATAMSYWPPQLNKGQEVVEQFLELVKQQETQPQQPHFAQTYLQLGDQYQKLDQAEYARQVWQRGAALFPNDAQFQARLQGGTTQQAAR